MNDIVDNAFEAELPEAIENEAVTTDEQAEIPENETPEQEEKRLTEAEWLKKERNTVSRRDKQISKLRADNEAKEARYNEAMQRLTKYERAQQAVELKEPQEGEFKNYHEYIRALEKFDRANDLKAFEERLNQKETHSVRSYQEQQFIVQSDSALQNATLEYAKSVPNIEAMIQEHGQTISSFPDSIKRVIREVPPQDVIKAFHAMVENDTLEDLADMTPVQAAAAIVRAASMPNKRNPITRAPAPIASARGTTQGQKTLNRMSPQELVDWVNS